MGNFTISDELKRAFKERNIQYFEIREASPEEFHDAIGRQKFQMSMERLSLGTVLKIIVKCNIFF